MAGAGKLLVTGFSAFPGSGPNPTERLVRLLEPHYDGDERLTLHVFKTSYSHAGQDLARLYAQERIVAALHLGLSQKAKGFVLERMAHNEIAARPDADGITPEMGLIDQSGPSAIPCRFAVEELGEKLTAAGVPTSFSDHAGGYLCNYILYRSLTGCGLVQPPRHTGFLHLPYAESQRAENASLGIAAGHYLADEVMLAGARIAVEHALALIENRAPDERQDG